MSDYAGRWWCPIVLPGHCDTCGNTFEDFIANLLCGGTTSSGGCGNSVLLSSGQFMFNLNLLSISSIGGNWGFGLKYLSGTPVDDIVGKGFNFPQYVHLEQSGSDVNLVSGNNTLVTFNLSGGVYVPASDNNSRSVLTRTGSGTSADQFTVTSATGVTTHFAGFYSTITNPGCVLSITDRCGNQQSYSWATLGGYPRLNSVTDSYGRTTTYSYYGSEFGYRLRQIEDFLGRKLNFQYDSLGHLVAVVTPSILKAADGNTFPGGTGYVFQYDVSNARSQRQDDLIGIWYPNQVAPFLDAASRTVDVASVYASATPRYVIAYGQDPTDEDYWGRVVSETVGDPSASVGGTYSYQYVTSGLPDNILNPDDPIVFRSILTDRNGNQTVYDFNANDMSVRVEVMRTRSKIDIPSFTDFPSYITWTKYNVHNQPLAIVYPEGNSVEFTYEDGNVGGSVGYYPKRLGLLLSETQYPGNSYGITAWRSGSNGQTQLSRLFFHDPLFNQVCATIERRGNPIAGSSTYFTPQNGGPTPSNTDRSRYATITYFDYQKDALSTVDSDTALQNLLGFTSSGQVGDLIAYVNHQMNVPSNLGPLLAGFEMGLGDINGDGTGTGNGSGGGPVSGTVAATHLGNVVKIKHPAVRLIGATSITSQDRLELFTKNLRGQTTTHTDPEGNLAIFVRYPENDPEGDGQNLAPTLSTHQYGRIRETHVDADPEDVMSLVGADGDLVDFISGIITRNNTPGVYQDLVTRYEGNSTGAGGCASCAYDPLGNPLAVTDPRGFTTRFERNEMGEVYRTTSPQPYLYQVETYYDANRNVVRTDTEDKVVQFDSSDPTSACYAQFTPSGSGGTAHVPMQPGPGGNIRPGWFTNLYAFDLLDNRIEEDLDATGSVPSSLVTKYEFDPNQNLILIIKPEGNTVEFDHDERNLRIAERVGNYVDSAGNVQPVSEAAVTVTAYDANGNMLQMIGPAARGGTLNHQTVTIADAFNDGSSLTHIGDFTLDNTYDGFDRVVYTKDAVGNVVTLDGTLGDPCYDPDGRVIKSTTQGPPGGLTPQDRSGNGGNPTGAKANVVLASSHSRYDEGGRLYEQQQDVFLNTGGTVTSPTHALVSSRTVTHTGGGLAINSTANDHTGTATLTTGGTSYVLTRNIFDRAGRMVQVLADNTQSTATNYDGANRVILTTDPLGNMVAVTHDPAGNVTQVQRTEVCTITAPEVSNEVFLSAARYDSLNRSVVQMLQGPDGLLPQALLTCPNSDLWEAAGNALVTLVGYDSRSNATVTMDPKRNSTVTLLDGASRAVQTEQHLRQAGQGQNPPEDGTTFLTGGGACIATTTRYDGNSRVKQLIDDRGNPTGYNYDTLDRRVLMTFQDGSKRIYAYDLASDVITYTDENGSVFTNTFDALGRRTQVDVTPAPGIGGDYQFQFQYDGLSRTQQIINNSGIGNYVFTFDSLSRTVEEYSALLGPATNSGFTSYPATEFTYPNERQVTNLFDELYRRQQVNETSGGTNIASWQFFGPGRVAETTLGNNLICTWMNNNRTHSAVQSSVSNPAWGDQSSDRLGYDGSGRPITKRYLADGINTDTHAYNNATPVIGCTTEYDPASNKLYERSLHAESRSHLYEPFDLTNNLPTGGYDSLDRLRQYQRGTLSSSGGPGNAGGGALTSAITLPNTNTAANYQLDGLGNWQRFITNPVGATENKQVRQHNGINEITSIKDGSDAKVPFLYDGVPGASNGNLADDGEFLYQYDAFNRLIEVDRKSDNAVIYQYLYDPLNRRVQVYSPITGEAINCGYFGWRVVQENYDSLGATVQYVWGGYLDELLQIRTDTAITTGSDSSTTTYPAGVYYPLQDLLYRTLATTDSSGNIVESYDYDAYGNTLIFNASGTSSNWFAPNARQVPDALCVFLFTGQRYDSETGNYYYKMRYYSSKWARFVTKDPAGISAGINFYHYVNDAPVNSIDPLGLISSDTAKQFFDAFLLPFEIPKDKPKSDFKDNECKSYLLARLKDDMLAESLTGLGIDVIKAPLSALPGGVIYKFTTNTLFNAVKAASGSAPEERILDEIFNVANLIPGPGGEIKGDVVDLAKKALKELAKRHLSQKVGDCRSIKVGMKPAGKLDSSGKPSWGEAMLCDVVVCERDGETNWRVIGSCSYTCTPDKDLCSCYCGTSRNIFFSGNGSGSGINAKNDAASLKIDMSK